MLYKEIVTVCSEIHTKHINTLCGQNVELLIVNHGGVHSNHWALKGEIKFHCSALSNDNTEVKVLAPFLIELGQKL
jgi:hypothetical protein